MSRFEVTLSPEYGLGCKIAGGVDSPLSGKEDAGVYLTEVLPGGAAEKAGLQVGDKILAVGSDTLEGVRFLSLSC